MTIKKVRTFFILFWILFRDLNLSIVQVFYIVILNLIIFWLILKRIQK